LAIPSQNIENTSGRCHLFAGCEVKLQQVYVRVESKKIFLKISDGERNIFLIGEIKTKYG
jgi:hypothetical protein